MIRKQKNISGFSLAELLIAVAVLAVVVIISSDILFTTFKSTFKAELAKDARQNGIYALSVIENNLRDAKQLTENSDAQACASNMKKIKIINQDGTETEFSSFYSHTEGSTKIKKVDYDASGAVINDQFLTANNITLASDIGFDCTVITAGEPEKIRIYFTITQKGSSVRPEERISVPFETTVYRRSFN